jgi:hypothetical protein
VVIARLLAALTAVVVGVPMATPAEAAIVPTSTKVFGAAIDAASGWERESGCSPTEKKGPRKLRKLLDATYGQQYSNIVRACSASDSGHEEGRALDWMVSVRDPAQKEMGDSFLAWLQAPDEFGNASAMARRLGIQYVIWNNHMWRPASGLTTEYSDCTKRKRRFKRLDSTCHRNHVHVSFSWDGALGRTSFFTGYVACPAPVPDVPVLGPVTISTDVVTPLEPIKILGTRGGLGMPAGKCKVHPDVPLELPVLGRGGIPATGVAEVVLQVWLGRPDAPATLHAWQTGTAMPAEPVVLDATGRLAEVRVPVGADGTVSLQLGGGMAHLKAYAVGWVAAAPGLVPPAA